jgi:hypothetical protein
MPRKFTLNLSDDEYRKLVKHRDRYTTPAGAPSLGAVLRMLINSADVSATTPSASR